MLMEPDGRVTEWLAAEQAGRPDEADWRFRAVARGIGRLDPPVWLAEAVATRLAALRTKPDVWSAWWLRAAVASAILSAGAAGAALPPESWCRALLASLRAVALSLGGAAAAAWAWVAGVLAVWSGLGRAAGILGRQFAGPELAALLAAQLALAAGALAALHRLMREQEP
ncbi:MAG TPA: hypothetical protein PLE61_12935 [Vicinamibacterales bacterium]|nr:hypothetical protein [Vicinamibacterales bacterium]HPW21705.1 hypothetical protein [Vicinamibacterales bacterium]